MEIDGEKIKEAVRHSYGGIARRFAEGDPGTDRSRCCEPGGQTSCCGPQPSTSCCGSSRASVETSSAATRYYSAEELAHLPDSVTDISLGCGNPLAMADLQPGEVVLDLGSGGGIDCFLAAKHVGPEGKVIGLDMTTEMIRLARRNARKMGVMNVDFRYGEMEEMPLADSSVDVVISNCVINLSPDKDAVFSEAFRVLRPGGRLSVSDVVLNGDLPPAIRSRLDAWAGCVAGALDEKVYLDKIRAAGFEKVEVLSRSYAAVDEFGMAEEPHVLVSRPDGQVVEGEEARALLDEAGISVHDIAHKVASIKVRACKPR